MAVTRKTKGKRVIGKVKRKMEVAETLPFRSKRGFYTTVPPGYKSFLLPREFSDGRVLPSLASLNIERMNGGYLNVPVYEKEPRYPYKIAPGRTTRCKTSK